MSTVKTRRKPASKKQRSVSAKTRTSKNAVAKRKRRVPLTDLARRWHGRLKNQLGQMSRTSTAIGVG